MAYEVTRIFYVSNFYVFLYIYFGGFIKIKQENACMAEYIEAFAAYMRYYKR